MLGAGRTDSGVHATGQVIAFDVTWKHSAGELWRAINANLPDDIALQSLDRRKRIFTRVIDATSRMYEYTLFVAPVRQPLLNKLCLARARRLIRWTSGSMQQAANQPDRRTRFRDVWPAASGRKHRPRGDAFRVRSQSWEQQPASRWSGTPLKPTPFCTGWCGGSWARWSVWAADT